MHFFSAVDRYRNVSRDFCYCQPYGITCLALGSLVSVGVQNVS
jgi:hypothetical protein